MSAQAVSQTALVLCVGDTSFLDYDGIKKKRQGYGPQGKGGNGLLLHSALAVDPENGRPLGMLWQKMWNRQENPKPPEKETAAQKKKRQAQKKKVSRQRSYEIELPSTSKRNARKAKLEVRCCWVELHCPPRLATTDSLPVYAVYANYAKEVGLPEGEDPVSWMLLTSEVVSTVEMAQTILRWYSYRWRVKEYHKVLKSGCQVERYRLAAPGMKTLLGFLCVTAVELLCLTYLERTQPLLPAHDVLTPLQLDVLKATAPNVPTSLTVGWALQSIARLGGYLEHRRKTPLGIQVLWQSWAKLNLLTEGWILATHNT